MNRREMIAGLGGAAAWPIAALAQQPAMPVIGYLSTRSPGEAKYTTDAFTQGLNEIGYVEGRNLAIEFRWAELQYDRLPALASDLVRRQVAAIVAVGGNPLRPCREDGDVGNSDRFRQRWRSGHVWSRRQPQPAGWQRDGHIHDYSRACAKTIGTAARVGPCARCNRDACKSYQSLCRAGNEGRNGIGARLGTPGPGAKCQHRGGN